MRYQLKKKRDEKNEEACIIADMDQVFRGGEKKPQRKDLLDAIRRISHHFVQESRAMETAIVADRSLKAALARWDSAFSPLAGCPEFHSAWELYFVMHDDIVKSSGEIGELKNILRGLEGQNNQNDKGGHEGQNKEDGKECAKSARRRARESLRSIKTAVERRNEAFEKIPSLETLQSGQSKGNGNSIPNLGKFWELFRIITTDLRNAYHTVYIVDAGLSAHPVNDVQVGTKTVGACLERIRNSINTLAGSALVGVEAGEGNTIIGDEDLEDLIKMAIKIEMGADSSIRGSSVVAILPASFGVMIRDLGTAYGFLRGSKLNKGEKFKSGNEESM